MRDRICLTEEQLSQLMVFVGEEYGEDLPSVLGSYIALEHFDVEMTDKKGDVHIARYDIYPGETTIIDIAVLGFFSVRALFEKTKEGLGYRFINENWILKERSIDRKIMVCTKHLYYALGINAYFLLYDKDGFDVEKKLCKKAQQQQLKKQCRREDDVVRQYRCYTLVKDWETKKPKQTRKKPKAHTVRGHFRTYASGKQIWVRPYERGKGEKTGKEYRLFPKQ